MSKNNPLVSVVIPTYNEGKYLRACLSSLKNSLRLPHEVIIVDSFSEDKTLEIAKEFEARILSVPKGNIGLARAKGFAEAKGSILISASADNIFPSGYFEALLDPLLSGKADVALGKISLQRPSFFQKLSLFLLNDVFIPIINLLGLTFSVADSIAFTRKVFEDIGFPEVPTGEDTLFVKEARRKGFRVVQTNAFVYTSDRRLRKWGTLRFLLFHFKNFVKANLTGEVEREYEVVR